MIIFKDKLTAILGAGVEGLSSAEFLKNKGALITVFDQKTKEELPPKIIEKFKELGVQTNLKHTCLEDLSGFEVIVRTPSVRPDLPEIERAVANKALLTSNTKIFFENSPCPIIGVTGTKGKGTTATLISEIIKRFGKRAFLGGNIGKAPLDFIDELTPNDFVVLELSSFQLFDLDKSPHVAVVLMVTSEHLDWHKDHAEYKEAKFNIVKYQGSIDFAVINVDHPISQEFLALGGSAKIQVSTKKEQQNGIFLANGAIYRRIGAAAERVVGLNEIGLIGAHNVENVAAAVGAATALKIPVGYISAAIKEFKGLEHRLEFVKEVGGVKYYNDSFSTTPETAIAAIRSFWEPEILVLGGSDKGSDYTDLGKEIVSRENIKALILIGQMGPKIREAIEKAGNFKGEFIEGAKDMTQIVHQARTLAKSGDIVLLSPACASFDMFENYKHRGELFKEEVSKL